MHREPYIYIFQSGAPGQPPKWHAAFGLQLVSIPVEREGRTSPFEYLAHRMESQIDLINSLFSPEPPCAFAIRYIVLPGRASFLAGRVEIVLLGKIQGAESDEARTLAAELCQQVLALVGGAMPDHVWKVVTDEATFKKFWEPFPWKQASVAEIRRREDTIQLETVHLRPSLGRGRTPPEYDSRDAVYLVHPFLPRYTTMVRLLRTMLLQDIPVVLQTAISPVWLTEEEERLLEKETAKVEQYLQRSEALGREALPGSHAILEARAKAILKALLQQLLSLQDAPYLLNVMMAGPQPFPRMLAEAAGVEITSYVGSPSFSASHEFAGLEAGGYDVVFPNSGEERIARSNISLLEFQPWGSCLAPAGLERIRWLVDAHEAAGAFRFPIATSEGLIGIEVHGTRLRPLPGGIVSRDQSKNSDERLRLGENYYLGFSNSVFMSESDRQHHVYIVGQTGTGKTTLLKTMISADMAAGRGLAVIDPHGDLFNELLGRIPESRMDDVVIVDPTDVDFPVGLNMLQSAGEERHYIVREMRAIMERLLEDEYGPRAVGEYAGPAFYQHMQMNMLLVMSNPDDPGTLLDFYEIFQRKDYWKRWVPLKWDEPRLKRWVEVNLPGIDYTRRSSSEMSWGEYLSSKFEDFVFDPKLRLIFGQKHSTIDLSRIMNERKILLVNLAKGELAEANSRFLGMIIMAKILAAAMSRVNLPPEQRQIFYLYVDEFQSLATQNFIIMLSEARKFGLGLILANQFVSQIRDERIIQSIFGNVGTLISFRVGHADAKLLEPHFSPSFDQFDLTNLPNWHACMKTTVEGQVVLPFTLHTIVPEEPPNPEIARRVREKSRSVYGRARTEVEKEISQAFEIDETNESN